MTTHQLPLADNWAHAYGGVCFLHYTIVWCTKFCRRVLVADVSDRVVLHTPNLAPAQLIYHLKRTTSRLVCQEYPVIQRRLKSLWTRSYLISTAENLPEELIMRYVTSQRGR